MHKLAVILLTTSSLSLLACAYPPDKHSQIYVSQVHAQSTSDGHVDVTATLTCAGGGDCSRVGHHCAQASWLFESNPPVVLGEACGDAVVTDHSTEDLTFTSTVTLPQAAEGRVEATVSQVAENKPPIPSGAWTKVEAP